LFLACSAQDPLASARTGSFKGRLCVPGRKGAKVPGYMAFARAVAVVRPGVGALSTVPSHAGGVRTRR
jgi:hypothetical protein